MATRMLYTTTFASLFGLSVVVRELERAHVVATMLVLSARALWSWRGRVVSLAGQSQLHILL